MAEVILKTKDMFKNKRSDFFEDEDFELWNKIAEFMDGEEALVTKSVAMEGQFVFLELTDPVKNKELHWMMEQDSSGIFNDDREEFDRLWDSDEYDGFDGCFYIEKEHIE